MGATEQGSEWTVSVRREGETEWPSAVEVTDVVYSTRVPGRDGDTCILLTVPSKATPAFASIMADRARVEVGLAINGKPSPPIPMPWSVIEQGEPEGAFATIRVGETGLAWACAGLTPVVADGGTVGAWRVRFDPAPHREVGAHRAIVEDGRKAFRSRFETAYCSSPEEEAPGE